MQPFISRLRSPQLKRDRTDAAIERRPCHASAKDLAEAVRTRSVSALELTDAAIARIEALDGPINAVVVRDFDRARDQARQVDLAIANGADLPLAGVPMTVKECFNVAGLPTTFGLDFEREYRPTEDAAAVRRLKNAGAVILGKTNVAMGLGDYQSDNPVYGRTNNPHDLARSPGGSSGGSAAVLAAGMVPLELGSDAGGSIRVPASFCGVFGHLSSFRIISLEGFGPPGGASRGTTAWAAAGPMARTAADLDLALRVLAGPEGRDATGYRLDLPPSRHDRLAGYRVFVLTEHPTATADDEIVAAIDDLPQGWRGLEPRCGERASCCRRWPRPRPSSTSLASGQSRVHGSDAPAPKRDDQGLVRLPDRTGSDPAAMGPSSSSPSMWSSPHATPCRPFPTSPSRTPGPV